MNGFRIRGLPAQKFTHLFALDHVQLAKHGARRMIARETGFPCRISLTDAAAGDPVILVNYEHHPVDTPFRSSFAIYVREGETTFDAVNEVPVQLRKRLLSLRGYDREGMLRSADVVDGQRLENGIAAIFADADVAYIHAHFAKPGCYAALIERIV